MSALPLKGLFAFLVASLPRTFLNPLMVEISSPLVVSLMFKLSLFLLAIVGTNERNAAIPGCAATAERLR